MVFRLLSSFPALLGLKPRADHVAASEIYGEIVSQARQPGFYSALGVPDSVEGRFDLLSLHVFLVLRRLKAEPAATGGLAQTIFDVMFQNMDDSLRELGVGDLRVGKKVRELAEMFYGRVTVYEEALAGEGKNALTSALSRNVFGSVDAAGATVLARYVRQADERLARQTIEQLMKGEVAFPPAPEEQND